MRNKLFCMALLLALTLSGCTLARPEAEEQGYGRFMGFFVTSEQDGQDSFYDNPNLTALGQRQVETEFGRFPVEREVLFAEYDEITRDFSFPGMEGWALFAANYEEDGVLTNRVQSDMADGTFRVTDKDGARSYDMEGTLYIGPPLDQPEWDPYVEDGWYWTFYRVYALADGRLYLDGSGDSMSSVGAMSYETSETVAQNGVETQAYTRVRAEIKEASRLTRVCVRQYGADGQLLGSEELGLTDEALTAAWLDGAEWAVVEEHSADGVKRTAYDRPEPGADAVCHQLILLDDAGVGRAAWVNII